MAVMTAMTMINNNDNYAVGNAKRMPRCRCSALHDMNATQISSGESTASPRKGVASDLIQLLCQRPTSRIRVDVLSL